MFRSCQLYPSLLIFLLFGVGAANASAQEQLVNLTTGVIGGGTIERNPDQTFYEIGTTVSLRAIADDGFVFQEWSGPVANPLSAETTVLLEQNTLVGATFVATGGPKLQTQPKSGSRLDFGTVETGLLSNARLLTVTVTNIGTNTLEGTAAVLAGTSRPFGVASGESFTLAAEQSAEIQVVFDPFNVDLNAGAVPLNGVLVISSNGGDAEILLIGAAIASGELGCSCASVQPGGKPLGNVLLLLAVLAVFTLVRPGAGARAVPSP